MLYLEDIYSGYGELKILNGVNIRVRPNEIVALIGPNGAGKSTVIKSIFSIAQVNAGKVLFKKKNITYTKTHELIEYGISYVNQGRIVFGNLSVRENLEIGADLLNDKEVVDKGLDMVFNKFPILKEKQKVLAYTLSGGQQQMLALGRALMQNPALLLLDEPSLGLSPKLQTELFETIKTLRDEDGISILIVEQNAKKAIEMADRTYLLEDGKIALEGGKEILDNQKIKNVYLGGHY